MGMETLMALSGVFVVALLGLWSAWRAKRRARLAAAGQEALNEVDHEELERRFDDLASPAILFELGEVGEETMALGRTRFGGRPDLPKELEWPRSPAGIHMSFLAQFDLAKMHEALPSSPLPPSGTLLFFAQCDDDLMFNTDGSVDAAVLHVPAGTALVRTDFPKDIARGHRFTACMVTGSIVQTYPELGHPAMASRLSEEEMNAPPIDFWSDMNEGSHLLGHADKLQEFLELEAESAHRTIKGVSEALSAADEARAFNEWRLLFQLADEKGAEMEWGDGGYLYFMIRANDLRDQRFDRVVCLLQTS